MNASVSAVPTVSSVYMSNIGTGSNLEIEMQVCGNIFIDAITLVYKN